MCNPLLIGAGLMLGGAAATHHGQKKAEKASLNVRRAEDARQKGHQADAESAFAQNTAVMDADTFKGNMRANAAQREAAYAQANAIAPTSVQQAASSAMGGNTVVDDNRAQVMHAINGRVAQHGAARADLGSFGDTTFDASLLLNRGREGIAQAGNFARGSAEQMGAELEAAKGKGRNARMLGSLLSAVGGAVVGGAGAAAGAAGATGSVMNPITGAMMTGSAAPLAGAAYLPYVAPMYAAASQGFVGPPA
jgi:hypothetical protein